MSVVDKTYSEAIHHGQPQDVPDDAATATHFTSVIETNPQEGNSDTHKANKLMVPRRSSRLRRPAVKLDPTSGHWSIGDQRINYIHMLGCRSTNSEGCKNVIVKFVMT